VDSFIIANSHEVTNIFAELHRHPFQEASTRSVNRVV
jgi:hypothetical protein